MIAVGDITARQEEVLAACTEGRQARRKADPARCAHARRQQRCLRALHRARHCWISRSPHHALQLGSDGRWRPRLMPRQYVPDIDWEAQGRKLMHVYPATHGPHNPNLGHSVGMAGARTASTSPRTTTTGWRRAWSSSSTRNGWSRSSAGCNVGDLLRRDQGRVREPQPPYSRSRPTEFAVQGGL